MYQPGQLIDHFHLFLPDTVVESIQPFGSGHINDTFLVQEPANQWILQRLNHLIFREPQVVMDNLSYVNQHLKTTTYTLQLLEAIRSPEGKDLIQDDAGNFWRLFPYIDSSKSYDQVNDPDLAHEGASAFGQFIKCLLNADPGRLKATIPDFHNGALRWAVFEAGVRADSQDRVRMVTTLIDLADANKHYLFPVQGMPLRIAHHDTKINNVLFNAHSGRAIAVIDPDTIMPGTVLSDFGDMVRTFTPTYDENEPDASKIEVRDTLFEALSAGFLSQCGDFLDAVERQHLVHGALGIVLMQAVRFLTDYIKGDIYYKISYPEHNLYRAKNQFALFEDLLRKKKRFEMFIKS